MTPNEFIQKWKQVSLTERATAQTHFNDLCALLRHEDPIKADPTGDWFAFEKGVSKTGGGEGFADVWKRGFFAWEYKRKKRNLEDALAQLVRYAAALENPPLQVACDTDRFVIRTAWTNAVPKTYEFSLDELIEPRNLEVLHSVFFDPEKLRPKETRAGLTKEAADKFSTIALRLQGRGTSEEIAHFVNQLVFCFFANSVRLLPPGFFPKLLKLAAENPRESQQVFNDLFAAMEKGGRFGLEKIGHFNGGLFDGRRALPLDSGDVGLLIAAASLDWSQIDPTIFGTLFERFLDPEKRGQIGAHYTDPEKIMMIVDPVILRPLQDEWKAVRAQIEPIAEKAEGIAPRTQSPGDRVASDSAARRLRGEAMSLRDKFLDRLASIRILDPACGSGNFLYLALQSIKDLENRVILECEAMGLPPRALTVGPEIVQGIEINKLAAELARTTIWIGDIQWGIRNGIYSRAEPILRLLDNIERRDALLRIGDIVAESVWPECEFIVGNPPFLGGKLMRSGLGDQYVDNLFEAYAGRVPPEADLVTYWFEKARAQLKRGRAKRIGFVATNSIRGGANRRLLDRIVGDSHIFEAWSDEPWVIDGAAVRVSLICFGERTETAVLDGRPVSRINADLTAGGLDLTKAKRLDENLGISFMGDTKGGAFDIPGKLARAWIELPVNPNGRSNVEVLRPWRNGADITRRSSDKWIIDFGWEMPEREASLFEAPFEYARERVLPERLQNQRESYRKQWWRHVRPRPALVAKVKILQRYIATPTVAKHRIFVWLDQSILPDHQLIVVTRDDDTTFGILHSRFHESWSLRMGTWLGVGNDPRYTPTTTFETFPFPEGLTPNVPAKEFAEDSRAIAIAQAARRLDQLRDAWLNPSDLVSREPEVAPGYPDRIIPVNAAAAAKLRERTLTNLYNERPQWLAHAHAELDRAVSAAYGWSADISVDDALHELLDLNLARAGTATVTAENPLVVGRAAFEKISEVEGIRLSRPMKDALDEIGADQDHREIVSRLRQVRP